MVMIPRRRSKRRRRKEEEDVGSPSETRAPGYGLRTRMSNDYCILHSTTGKLSPLRVPGCEGKKRHVVQICFKTKTGEVKV